MGLPLTETERQPLELVCGKDQAFDLGCAESEVAIRHVGTCTGQLDR